ncbi:TPA: PAAR domain-containing protein [Escherichia coli]|nr:PAAR domain-containing protein [Escherichia coli]HAJ0615957.1 PAAR domain-containing protein [Escherichia coli]HAJ0753299.1 PAAR domain-containing protein [Escherichia coli]
MGTGYFLVRGDKTTCGGKIIEGADDHTIMGIPQARDMDRVTCGRYPGMFIIVGGVPETDIHGRLMAGTLDSQSSCPCKARFIASMMDDTYETDDGGNEPEQHAQSAKKDLTSGSDSSSDDVKLDYRIKLSGNKILTPLNIPDYKEMISGGSTKNTEKIDFTITNKGDETEALSLEVLDGNEVIYSERQTGKYCDKGEHAWQWDGYSNQGILDTTKIKSKSLLVRLIALCGDMMIKVDYPLKTSANEEDWIDVKVDKNQKIVDVSWRVEFEDDGVSHKDDRISPVGFEKLKQLAKDGMEYYWARNGMRNPGIGNNITTPHGKYNVNISVSINIDPAMDSFDLIEEQDLESVRSSAFMGRMNIYFNRGYYEYGRGYKKGADPVFKAGLEFKLDVAHETGHMILKSYGGNTYSWEHKGTSNLVPPQYALPHSVYPGTGEIDLMKYYDGHIYTSDLYARSVAVENDVCAMIWLSRVKFHD